jgi:predicted aminopeptidase
LGFFQKSQAESFANKMRDENDKPDVWVRGVPAFSSLGWFSDPLYSSMIIGGEQEIADVVIHESLHATVWVGDSVDFNEKLANFVGLEGSLRYLQTKHPSGEELAKAKRVVAGEKIFGLFIRNAIDRYKRDVKTLADKQYFYDHLEESYDAFFAKAGGDAEKLPAKFLHWNNAALLAYANYYSDYSIFEEMLAKCDHDLGRFVRWIVHTKNKPGRFLSAPEEVLGDLVKIESCVN